MSFQTKRRDASSLKNRCMFCLFKQSVLIVCRALVPENFLILFHFCVSPVLAAFFISNKNNTILPRTYLIDMLLIATGEIENYKNIFSSNTVQKADRFF